MDEYNLFIKTPHRFSFISSSPSCLLFPPLGVVTLSQALCSSDDYSNSLLHLDLSKNPGVLSGEDATVSDTHTNAQIKCASIQLFLIRIFDLCTTKPE